MLLPLAVLVPHVPVERARLGEGLAAAAVRAVEGPLARVGSRVPGEVVGAGVM